MSRKKWKDKENNLVKNKLHQQNAKQAERQTPKDK